MPSLKIYMCAFLKKNYIEEAKICIESIRKNGKFYGEIFLITDMDVKINNVNIIKTKIDNVNQSAGFRLRVFDFIKYNDNDIFLYLDTDVVVLKPISSYNFTKISNKIHVYGYNQTQKGEKFAGFISNDIKILSQPAFCSGILFFRPTKLIKKVFKETWNSYLLLIKNKKINKYWEQPILCFNFIKNDLIIIDLNKYVYEEQTKTQITENIIFNHFCELRGENRKNLMKKYL